MQKSALSPAYLTQVESVLEFDLSHNGFSRIAAKNSEKELQVHQKENNAAFHPEKWKSWGIVHVLKSSVVEKNLSVYVFSSQTGTLKHFNDIPLTGDLAQDRRQIHKLADAIQKALFSVEGIASSRILYSVQMTNPKADGTVGLRNLGMRLGWQLMQGRSQKRTATLSRPVFIPSKHRHANDRFLICFL